MGGVCCHAEINYSGELRDELSSDAEIDYSGELRDEFSNSFYLHD
jgi:hypothetical protein